MIAGYGGLREKSVTGSAKPVQMGNASGEHLPNEITSVGDVIWWGDRDSGPLRGKGRKQTKKEQAESQLVKDPKCAGWRRTTVQKIPRLR